MNGGWAGFQDERKVYEWGRLFASPWSEILAGMAKRAAESGLKQTASERSLTWSDGDRPVVRYVFVDDPSDFDVIRGIFNDETNVRVPVCFVVVRQPDESETRGDVVFDIFRLSPKSYLWHFYRVYTPPATRPHRPSPGSETVPPVRP